MSRITKRVSKRVLSLVMLVFLAGLPAQCVFAQTMSKGMRETFRDMLPLLDAELQSRVRNAMNLNRDFLELTPEQFKRFRDHPANPFEGWDSIDPDSINGLIRLRFETESIRSREPTRFEKQSSVFLAQGKQIVQRATAGTVVVTDGKTQIALGTVVSAEGHVVTKLSEVVEADKLFCRLPDGQTWSAELIALNEANDIGILKIPEKLVPAVVFAAVQPEVGGFIYSTNGKPAPMAFGIYSNPPRSLIGQNQAFLGVKPMNDANGVRIVEVTAGSSAEDVGLQIDDVLTGINGVTLTDVQSLVNEIRKNNPGNKVIVDFVRQGKRLQVEAVLAGRNVGGPTADRFNQMKSFGAIQSERRDEFPLVFQHDTPLVPEECGGPVTNLDGEVIGINIARGGRVASYAIPANHLQLLVREMLRPNVASTDLD